MKYIIYWVRDNDSLMSSSKDTAITVRLAPPVLWGDKTGTPYDTTFIVINNSVGVNYKIHINSRDTNGTIQKYIWNFNNTLDSSAQFSTTDSQYTKLFTQIEMNQGQNIWIYGRDNDGLLRGGQFTFYADSVPPAPVINAVTASDSITIYFKNKDTKDGNATQYRILVHDGSEPDSTRPADIQSNWKSGYRASDDSFYDYMFKFKLPTNTPKHGYYYQVHARDARGSVTSSTMGHTFSY